jgi:hypothetical protein
MAVESWAVRSTAFRALLVAALAGLAVGGAERAVSRRRRRGGRDAFSGGGEAPLLARKRVGAPLPSGYGAARWELPARGAPDGTASGPRGSAGIELRRRAAELLRGLRGLVGAVGRGRVGGIWEFGPAAAGEATEEQPPAEEQTPPAADEPHNAGDTTIDFGADDFGMEEVGDFADGLSTMMTTMARSEPRADIEEHGGDGRGASADAGPAPEESPGAHAWTA